MSKVTMVVDNMLARLQAVLPESTQLPVANFPEVNPSIYLRAGLGVEIGQGSNSNRVVGDEISIRRSFRVTITRELIALENDASAKVSAEKALMVDAFKVVRGFMTDVSLNSDGLAGTTYQGDSGVSISGSSDSDSGAFLVTVLSFETEIFENINS